jgi:carbon-monoxide dehydrogenase large subunit
MTLIGKAIARSEDERFLRGEGRFTDDLHLAGIAEATVLRSPHAHARIRHIDVVAACKSPGVLAVWTWNDLQGMQTTMPMIIPDARIIHPKTQELLARDVVRYVGEPVVFVVAENRYLAEDATDLVTVEYEPLVATKDLDDAITCAAQVHPAAAGNIAGSDRIGFGDVAGVLKTTPRRWKHRFKLSRGHAQSLEGRVTVARYDADTPLLTVWDTTQGPIPLRDALADFVGLQSDQVRVIAGDIGGGFGPKMAFYVEQVLVAAAAMRLGRPVKWVEDRLESFVATASEREQIHEVEVAYDNDGRLLALRDNFYYETGAYIPYGLNTPFVTSIHLLGLYQIPAFEVGFQAIFTNRMFCCPYRGAGRPYSAFVIERVLDHIAADCSLDVAEVRQRNLIPASAIPYRYPLRYWDGGPVEYDSGDYPAMLERALDLVGYANIRDAQQQQIGNGPRIGVGIACYAEITGIGPYEGVRVRVRPDGRITVASGGGNQGQGHHTTVAQVIADGLGVAPEQIDVVLGDTGRFDWGIGTFASRGAVTVGNAARIATAKLADQAREWAAEMLEVAKDDLELVEGQVRVKGVPQYAISLAEIAARTNPSRGAIKRDPNTFRPGLEAEGFFNPAQGVMGAGVHACVVEVDPETGVMKLLKYVAVHDCGLTINPSIVDGQVAGGIALGVGGAFYENLVYDETGQLLTGTYMDYLIPTAAEVPEIIIEHFESRSPHNPLGVKGVGEAGTIPAAAVIVSAIEDALRSFGVRLLTMPVAGPAAICDAIIVGRARALER